MSLAFGTTYEQYSRGQMYFIIPLPPPKKNNEMHAKKVYVIYSTTPISWRIPPKKYEACSPCLSIQMLALDS